ncbi:MAG: DUF1611 domain-containing protein [Acetobacteraceae bacterium]
MRGARSVVIGVANIGGVIRDNGVAPLSAALEAGLDIVSGMHGRLQDTPALRSAARHHGRNLIDARTPPASIMIATGRRRSGRRLLTVRTDCAVGKKYTVLALARAFKSAGAEADFRATGQTGMLIAGGRHSHRCGLERLRRAPTRPRATGMSSKDRGLSCTPHMRACRPACCTAVSRT